ncbi:MAG TPA: hypothetical protein PKA60_02730 [Candidatus Paceibacterota bacterium]|nr:hypothetical protein [Candidatus Paceibacterota bacterium]
MLKTAQPTEAVRFADVDFDSAISEGAFWLILPKDKSQREGTVRLISLANMTTIIERDEDRPVFRHQIEFVVNEKPVS